jgi:hypothetical protein
MTVSMRASRDSLEADAVDALTDVLTQAGFQVRQGRLARVGRFLRRAQVRATPYRVRQHFGHIGGGVPPNRLRIDRAFGPITATRLPGLVATGGHPWVGQEDGRASGDAASQSPRRASSVAVAANAVSSPCGLSKRPSRTFAVSTRRTLRSTTFSSSRFARTACATPAS